MPARMIVDFSESRIVLLGGGPEPGTPDTGLFDGATRASSEVLKQAFQSIGELTAMFEAAVAALPQRPETVEVEFAATLSSEGDLWIVSDDAAPEFRIRLSWEKP